MKILLTASLLLIAIATGVFAWKGARASWDAGHSPGEQRTALWGDQTAAKVAILAIPLVVFIWFVAGAPGGTAAWFVSRALVMVAFILLARVVAVSKSK